MIIKHNIKASDHSILLPFHLIEKMSEVAIVHFPYEFGGILTGFKAEKQDIIVDFEIPTKYIQTETSFTRRPDGLNKYLSNIYKQSNGNIEYLGEWHTHPNGTANFSAKDYTCIEEIANDKNSKTISPIMIIFSIKKNKYDYNVYKYVDGSLVLYNKKERI